MKSKIYSLLLLSIIFIIVLSCKKDEEDKKVSDEATQSVFDNIFTLVNDEMNDAENGSSKSMNDACPAITVTNQGSYISNLTIDFGDSYCTPPNSTDRYKGRLIVTATGSLW